MQSTATGTWFNRNHSASHKTSKLIRTTNHTSLEESSQHLKILFRGCMLDQIFFKKQTFDPAAPSSVTLADSAVTVRTYRLWRGYSTQPYKSSTPTVNGCDLTPPTLTRTSEQEYRELTVNDRITSEADCDGRWRNSFLLTFVTITN